MSEENVAEIDNNESPRLEPIENPDSLMARLSYWVNQWQMGKVITPLKVIYARFPESLGLARALKTLEDKFTIDRELIHLIQTYVASINGCAFCIDMAKASYQQNEHQDGKLDELMRFEESTAFPEAEKAALAYVDEATRNKQVEEETFQRLREHYSEREIVQITMINAVENFYNLMNAPLNIGSDELCELWLSDGRQS